MKTRKYEGKTYGVRWVQPSDSHFAWTYKRARYTYRFWTRAVYREGVLAEVEIPTLQEAIGFAKGYEVGIHACGVAAKHPAGKGKHHVEPGGVDSSEATADDARGPSGLVREDIESDPSAGQGGYPVLP